MTQAASWGRYPRTRSSSIHLWQACIPPGREPMLAFGNGRSYGDVCLNDGGHLLMTRKLDRFIAFDAACGVLRCEAGVLLSEILQLVVPQGWFLPVCPGTSQVTVGGAIANDVHGKNHHHHGSFGRHVHSFELLRSDGRRLRCSPTENPDWFGATIGGLGLTGLIAWAELALVKIPSQQMQQRRTRFAGLEEFLGLSLAAQPDWEYAAAWLDCLASGRQLGRGVFVAGRHVPDAASAPVRARRAFGISMTPPFSLVNGISVRALNQFYYRTAASAPRESRIHYQPFLFPLDALSNWNRLYGPRGFLQYQCVIPPGNEAALLDMLSAISRAHVGSFLAVLKMFGDRPSPGWLSFPRPGVTLALDFPGTSASTLNLLARLDAIVIAADGAVYPAKDARMSAALFASGYPALDRFEAYRDPAFSSSLWRRLRSDSRL